MWDLHGARISDPDLNQILGRGGGFQQLAPGSQLAWRRTNFMDMNSNHRFFWGWTRLYEAYLIILHGLGEVKRLLSSQVMSSGG